MNEKVIRSTGDAMISSGLYSAGYRYLNLDDCWAGGREANGTVYSDPLMFPSGMQSLSEYIHNLNLKFGIYTDRGTKTCGGRVGSGGYEALDANTYALWGVDYVKEDSCYASQDHDEAIKEYGMMRDALNATGRPIFFALCGWEEWYAPVGKSLGNSWRIGPDDTDWAGVLTNIDIESGGLDMYSGPGGWNDPCLLLSSDHNGNSALTELQSRAQFSMWAIMASPLIISGNIRQMSPYTLETYTNHEVIAVDQDVLGKQGKRINGGFLNETNTNIWARQLKDGYAMVFLNIGPTVVNISCDVSCFGVLSMPTNMVLLIRDLWSHQTIGTFIVSDGFTAVNVPSDGGVLMLKLTPQEY
jgi:alpha-galactosidase